MPGFFSLEGAKTGLGLVDQVETTIREAEAQPQAEKAETPLRHIPVEADTLWHKIDHLLYLPLLNLTRPRDLYYYQGTGLQVLYGFTYKYLTVEHFLGQLTRLQIGYPLAQALAGVYAQNQYPGHDPLVIFTDWHVKPHWTKAPSHSGHVTMWGRTMPGTKQLIINGQDGYLLGGWNYQIDTHMTQVLVKLEAELSQTLNRPILCNIFDSEGGGQPVGQAYAQAGGHYLSILSRQHNYALADFTLQGQWQTVIDDPEREAVYACWRSPQKAATDPRQLVLLRPLGQPEPTRIYTGRLPAGLPAAVVPWCHRQRWRNNERPIRDLVNGANLNENYGYTYNEVSHRTRQRQWEAAQAQVEVSEQKLAQAQAAIRNLRQKQRQGQISYEQQRLRLQKEICQQRQKVNQQQAQGKASKRLRQGEQRRRREIAQRAASWQKQHRRLHQELSQQQERRRQVQVELAQRGQQRDSIDTETLCRQRHLEKDQIMLNWQVMLINLHDWLRQQIFDPTWQHLSLEKAKQLIYCKAGCVQWHEDRIEITLDSYRYQEHQQAMANTCRRFNQANLRWRDGRLLQMAVKTPP